MALSVAILGSGNMAYHLLSAFDKSDIRFGGLIVRDLSQGRETLDKTNARCELIGSLHLENLEVDVIILAVPEQSIQKVLKFYKFNPNHIVVHTSGAEPMDSLQLERVGVFYPLQTLTWGQSLDLSNVPIFVEGSNIAIEESLMELAKSISNSVISTTSESRLVVHMAAVLASNFPNHLFMKAEEILKSNGQELSLLHPLIDETVKKLKALGPLEAQTGPARRKDEETMKRHLELIDHPELKAIYSNLSQSITKTYE